MRLLLKLADAIDALIDRVGWFAAALTLAMVLLISGNTLGRYFFNASTIWLQELEWHLLAMVAFLGLAYMQLRGVPVRVDMFYQRYPERVKLWLEFGVALLVMLPFSIFICVLGWRFVLHSYELAEVSPDPGGTTTDILFFIGVLFVAGILLEWVEISYIVLPLFIPYFVAQGVNLVWLAAIICIVLQTSFLTPPVGWSLFLLRGVAPKSVATANIHRRVWPFIWIQMGAAALVLLFPKVATWLPAAIGWAN
jgi:TRAP-type mannitol/chloroaromatic compound transport system permease small subunit